MGAKKIFLAEGEFEDATAAIVFSKAVAKDLVWRPNIDPSFKLCVVDEFGNAVDEISLVKPAN